MRKIKLRTKFIGALLIAVLVPCIVFLCSLKLVTSRFDALAAKQLNTQLASLKIFIAREEENITNRLERTAQTNTDIRLLMLSRPVDFNRLTSLLETLLKSIGLDFLELIDKNGVVIASAHNPAEIGELKLNDSYIRSAISGKLTSGISEEKILKETCLAIKSAVPIYHRKEIVGVLSGGIKIDRKFLAGLKPISADLLLIRDDKIITNTIIDDTGREISNEAIPLDRHYIYRITETSDSFPKITIADVQYSIAGIPLNDVNGNQLGILATLFSHKEMAQTINSLQKVFFFLTIIGFFISIAVGYLISLKITKPVSRLAQAAVAIGKGDYEQQIDVSSTDEIGDLVSTFNSMIKQIKDQREKLIIATRLAEWREAARKIAHEIKNPLTSIRISLEGLLKKFGQDDSTAVILEEVNKLKRIVDEFSEFARMPKPRKEWINPIEVLTNSVELYSNQKENIQIKLNFQEKLPKLFADPDQLHRAFSNIIKNAIEAMPNGGELSITVLNKKEPEESLLFEFKDTGIGMDKETLSKLFTPYFSTKRNGTGLGLAIVQQIVSEHDGKIMVESELQKGSKFTLIFPVKN